jgi:hypothetical protein
MKNELGRRQIRFVVWMALYSVIIVADGYLLPRPAALDAVHVAGALVPMIPLAFAGFEVIARVRAMDELQRRIHLEGMLFGVVGTSVVILSVGLLQWIAALPTFSVGWLWVVLCAFYGLGTALAHRRYA